MTSIALTTLLITITVAVVVALLTRPRNASTIDYYLAGQRIGIVTNACAICGDYFSAASFLGVAAAVYASGLDGVWYATGFAAGFVPVLLFVAAPLRRFGEFSIPDFLGRRLESERVRLTAVVAVQLVILSYLVPQAVGTGLTWELLVGTGLFGMSAYSTGVALSTVAITAVVVVGGMRGTTWTQAVQFVILLAVLLWLTAIVLASGFDYPGAVERVSAEPLRTPVLVDGQWVLTEPANRLLPEQAGRFGEPGASYGRLGQFALVVTLVLGTAGLPHIMNRYFTSPSGTATRMTTVWVLGLAGLFYSLAVLLGTAARQLIPEAVSDTPWLAELTVGGVLRVPEHALLALGRLFAGNTGLGLIAIGALVAIMSTIAGLLLAAAASWGHDVYERHVNPQATERQAVRAGRAAVLVVSMASAVLALGLQPETLTGSFPSVVATMVTWAFALAGSALTPVFILAIWWRGTTAAGATAGIALGGTAAVTMFAAGVLLGERVAEDLGALLLTPTLIVAPLVALTTVVVSLRTTPPAGVERAWLVMHGTARDREAERLAALTIRGVRSGARSST